MPPDLRWCRDPYLGEDRISSEFPPDPRIAMRPIAHLFCTLALLHGSPAISFEAWPPQEPPREEWHELLMDTKKVGFLHVDVEATGDDRVAVTLDTEMRVRRVGEQVKMASTARFVETRAGRPVSVEYVESVAANSTRTNAVVEGDSLILVSKGLESASRRAIFIGDTALVFPWTADRLLAGAFAAEAPVVRYRSFLPEMAAIQTFDVELLGVEDVEARDATIRALHTRTTISGLTNMTTDEWRDISTGSVVRSHAELMGIKQETVLSNRAKAKSPPLDYTLDLIFETLVESKRRIPRPRTVDELLLRVEPRGETRALRARLSWPPHQIVVEEREVAASVGGDAPLGTHPSDSNPALRLRIRRPEEPAASYELPYAGGEWADELAPSLLIQSGDEELRRIAAELIGAERDPLAAARGLNQWVFRSMSKKGFSVGFASALEALRRREGDCTEHALLLTALCRSVGIPARAVSGLIYFRGAFGYHMWTEVFTGVWFPLDPAFGLDSVDATHVKIAADTMAGGATGSSFVPLLDVMGRIDLEVVEYMSRGSRFTGARPALEIDGASVRSPEHRIAFKTPPLWRPTEPRELPADYLQMFYPPEPSHLAALAVKAIVVGYDFSLGGAENEISRYVGGFESRRATRIGHTSALRLEFKDPVDGLRRVSLIFLDGDTYFMFTLENPADGDVELFDAMISTIELGRA